MPLLFSIRAARALKAAALCAALSAAAVTLSASPARAATRLRVDASALPCPNRATVESNIAERLERSLPLDGDYDLTVQSDAPAGLRIVLARPSGGDYQRVVPFHDTDCPVVEDIVVAIARGWLQKPWRSMARAAVEATPPAVVADAPPAPPSGHAFFRLSLAAGGFTAPRSDQVGPTAAAGLEWSLSERWGLAAQAAYDGSVVGESGSGSTRVSMAQFAALVRCTLVPTPTGGLDLLAGPSLHLISATSTGYATANPRSLTDPSLTAAARWRHAISPNFAAFVSAGLSARAHNEVFSVLNRGTVLTVPAWRGNLLVGLDLRLD